MMNECKNFSSGQMVACKREAISVMGDKFVGRVLPLMVTIVLLMLLDRHQAGLEEGHDKASPCSSPFTAAGGRSEECMRLCVA